MLSVEHSDWNNNKNGKQIENGVMISTHDSDTWSIIMIEVREDGEEEDGEAAVWETDVTSRTDADIRRLIEFKKSTSKEEIQCMKELSKSIKNVSDSRKKVQRQQVLKNKNLEDFRNFSNSLGINSVKKKVLVIKT